MNYSFDPKFRSIYQDALIKAGMFPGGPSFDSAAFSGAQPTSEPTDSDWRVSTSVVNHQANVSGDRNDYYPRRRSRSRSRSRDQHRRRSRSRSRDRRSRSRERSRRNRSRSRSNSRYASRSPPRHRRTSSPDPVSAKVMMNNLPIDASRDTISYLMARQGFHALDIRIVRRTSESGMVRVFGFVEFNTPAQAQSWMKFCDGTLLFEDGTRARLEFSREMEYDSRRPAPGSSDWTCAKCTINNFNRRSSCFKCGMTRQESEAMEAKGYALVGVHPSDTLLIRELPASATEEIVRSSLAQYTGCVIQRVYVAPSKSYALIQMKSVEDASYVLSTFNKLVPYIDNCAVIVTFSRLSLNQVLLKDNVNVLKSQSGITSANIQQDPTNSAALLAQNALMMVQMGKQKVPAVGDTTTAARESVSTPFGYLQSYPTPDRSTFQLEPVSGYMYDSVTTFYFDPKTEYYFNSKLNQWMFWCSRYSTYIPCDGGDQDLKKRLQADEKADQRTRSSAIISAPPSASMAGDELAHTSSTAASSAEQNKIAGMLQACMEQNKMIMTVLNKMPDAKAADTSNTLKRRRPSGGRDDNDVIEIGRSRKPPSTDERIFVDRPMAARPMPGERRVVVNEDVMPRDRIVLDGMARRDSRSPADYGRPESSERRRFRPNVEEAIRVVERRNGRGGPLPDWEERVDSPRHRPASRDRRSRSPPPVQPPRRCRWSDREEGPQPHQPLQKSPIVQMRPILPPAFNVPPILAALSGLLPPGLPIPAGLLIPPLFPLPQPVPAPRLSVSLTPGSTRSVHIQPPMAVSSPVQLPPNIEHWKIADTLDRNRKYLMKLERERQCEELMKQAMADRENDHLARRQQLLVKEQEDIQSLNICLNCGREGHPKEKCRRSRISDDAMNRIITNAKEHRDKERILKDKMKKEALDKYKCKRNDPLMSRLREVVPDGKIMKPVFNAMCENCSHFGHTKIACRNATVNRSVIREVREAINEFLRVFFFNFQDGEVLDFSKKFKLFKMMDMVEASEIDPVNVQLRSICPNGIVRTRDLQLCSNCASLGHKSQYCARELSDRRHYEKILQLVTAYRALIKEKGHLRLKNFVPLPQTKKTNSNGELITLEDSDGEKAANGDKPDSDDDVEWIVNSGDEIELADEERDEEEETVGAALTDAMVMIDEVRTEEDDEIMIVDRA